MKGHEAGSCLLWRTLFCHLHGSRDYEIVDFCHVGCGVCEGSIRCWGLCSLKKYNSELHFYSRLIGRYLEIVYLFYLGNRIILFGYCSSLHVLAQERDHYGMT